MGRRVGQLSASTVVIVAGVWGKGRERGGGTYRSFLSAEAVVGGFATPRLA